MTVGTLKFLRDEGNIPGGWQKYAFFLNVKTGKVDFFDIDENNFWKAPQRAYGWNEQLHEWYEPELGQELGGWTYPGSYLSKPDQGKAPSISQSPML